MTSSQFDRFLVLESDKMKIALILTIMHSLQDYVWAVGPINGQHWVLLVVTHYLLWEGDFANLALKLSKIVTVNHSLSLLADLTLNPLF